MPYYGLYVPIKGNGSGGIANTGAVQPPSSSSASHNALNSINGSTLLNVLNGKGSTQEQNSDKILVFNGKHEALEVLKMHKDARMREFICEDDAIKYAQSGYEAPLLAKHADPKGIATASLEKAAFRGPTKQEFIEFRKIIESGDLERVKKIIWDNPRYLVSSGDTPTTLKEGYRYNAMHICAISNKPRIAELILQTVSDPNFTNLLTGKKGDEEMCKELCTNLLDYYLNIPEKGRSETPLHLASKNGTIEMVEVLTSYPECKMTKNKEGFCPKEIICSRVNHSCPELIRKIEVLFAERFYVPVLRYMDNTLPAQIGEPFSSKNPPNLNSDPLSPEVKIQAIAGPMNKDQAKQFLRRWKTPPRIGSNSSSPLVNNPFLSPRNIKNIECSTPTKLAVTGDDKKSPSTPSSHHHNVMMQRRALFSSMETPNDENNVCNDVDKIINQNELEHDIIETVLIDKRNGNHRNKLESIVMETNYKLENNNNNHEQLFKIPHRPFKPILCPPRTPVMKAKKEIFYAYRNTNVPSPIPFGLLTLNGNESLIERDRCLSPGYKERHIKISDTEKGLEVIGRQLAKDNNVGWREFWDFLNIFIDISSPEGFTALENYLLQRDREINLPKRSAPTNLKMDDVCSALDKLCLTTEDNSELIDGNFVRNKPFNVVAVGSSAVNLTPQTTTTPYTCVEKSLQVFAKRMTKTITHNLDDMLAINDTMFSELKRLKSLISSFKEDTRFVEVNFGKVHSRIGNLISIYLVNSQEVDTQTKFRVEYIIKNLLCKSGNRREHIECVFTKIINFLAQPGIHTLPDNLKTEQMYCDMWQNEDDCTCQWESNLSRKTSRRNRLSSRFKSCAETAQYGKTNKIVFDNPNEDSDDMNDVFWSDCGETDTDDDEDVWVTPCASPSQLILFDEDDKNAKIYIYGNEPTKRDLDVLNAIFHIEIDKNKYPNIYSWKTELLRYSNEDMDCFPSPSIVKTQSSIPSNMQKKEFSLTLTSPSSNTILLQKNIIPDSSQNHKQLPSVKRLFNSPAISRFVKPTLSNPSASYQQLVTPINKKHGLFSAYRENIENTPIDSSPNIYSSDVASDGSTNLSLFNVSAME